MLIRLFSSAEFHEKIAILLDETIAAHYVVTSCIVIVEAFIVILRICTFELD